MCPSRPGSWSEAHPSNGLARSRRTSASSANLSRTRARGSATRASMWRGRSVSGHDAGSQCMTVLTKPARRLRRRRRVRAKVRGSAERPRISVFRSNRGISAQLIDDDAARTIASVNWIVPELRSLKRMEQARRAGALLAERAKAAGVEAAVFDRGGYQYHGRVQALADGARQ